MDHVVAAETVRPRRKSAFHETGLFDDDCPTMPLSRTKSRPGLKVRFRSSNDIFEIPSSDDDWEDIEETDTEEIWDPSSTTITLPITPTPTPVSILHRLTLVAFVLAIVIPLAHFAPLGSSTKPILGATGVPLAEKPDPIFDEVLNKRDNNPADYCKRWSQQSTQCPVKYLVSH